MKLVYLALNWVFGVLFLLTGLFSIVESPLGGICLIVVATLLLPPVKSFVYSKTNKELPVKARAISIFILFIAFGVFIGQSQDRKAQELAAKQTQEQAEKAAQLRQEKIDYFNTNRSEIILSVKELLSAKDYKAIVSQAQKYSVVKDKELEEINANAKKELNSIKKAKKTKKILAELKTIPSKEYERNLNLYQQLVTINPSSQDYKKKHHFYQNKVTELREKEKHAKAKLQKEVRSLVGKKVPYEKWAEWGMPETLKGTNNQYWVAYLPKVNVSFVSEKKSDKVIHSGFNKNSAINFITKKEKARKELIEHQFSAWDGSHRGLERIIKKTMNDPDSYDHVETVYWDMGKHLVVKTTFRGKNAFGGVVINWVKAKSDMEGNIIEIMESYP